MLIDKSNLPEDIWPLVDLLMSEEWPDAVPPFLICSDSEEDKTERADGILDYVNFDLTNKRFCDFGCGEGHLAFGAAEKAEFSAGFDIKKSGNKEWEKDGKCILTNDLQRLRSFGLFDYIVLYDVLDHSVNPLEVLENVASISHKGTKVFVRCHSWMSRHGGHLYQKLNKAWAHLIFTQQELRLMGLEPENIYKTYYPLATQGGWFKSLAMKIESSDIVKTVVEPFFKKPEFSQRLPYRIFNGQFPEWQMSQVFVDYYISTENCS
jgi:2-polyprenyl-3-methyl-5-hydroxy-6-metoxy-1,4-benzoquinol methylase